MTAGNDVVDLSKLDVTGFSVNIGDAFSSDNDKVTVMAGALQKNNLKLTSIENLEIVNSNVQTPVILNGTNFKGLEAVKLIGDATILNVSDFTQGVTIDATANADSITGSDKADTINGGAGNDTIVGNDGDDVLTGGNGADEFVVGTVKAAGVDQILDFSAEDKISLKGFFAQELKKFDASTFSTVTYKTLDSVLATFRQDGANETKTGDVVIFSYDGKTYALLANGAFIETGSALVDITGANVASLTESNFGTSGTFENYAAFKVAVEAGKVATSTATIKSITAHDAAALLTTDASYLDKIADGGIGAVTETPVNVTMTKATLDTSGFAKKLGAGVPAMNINITSTVASNEITSSFAGSIKGGTGNDKITVSATGTVTIDDGGGTNEINGGSGNDMITIIGAGTNKITTGAGNDFITLNSSTGVDTVVFGASNANGMNTITGFKGGSSGDKLDVSAFTGSVANSNGVVASALSSAKFNGTAKVVIVTDKDALEIAEIKQVLDGSNSGIKTASTKVVIIAENQATSDTAGKIYYITTNADYSSTNLDAFTVETVGSITATTSALAADNIVTI